MVNEDEDFIFLNFQVITLSVKSFNDSQKLLVVSLVTSFSGDYFSRQKAIKYH